jgi:signal transduction histidine kinase
MKVSASKRFLLAAFRIIILVPGLIELTFGRGEYVYGHTAFPVIGVLLYTAFKVIHPLQWYQPGTSRVMLTALDLAACAGLLVISARIDMPFMLYTLAPVLTSALLFSRPATMTITAITAVYFTAFYLTFPIGRILETLSSIYATYLSALGLTAVLPYAINTVSRRQLQSKVITEERHRIGREIHDSIAQDVNGLLWEIQMIKRNPGPSEQLMEKLGDLEQSLAQAEKDVRGSIDALRTIKVERSLMSQIKEYLTRLQEDFGIQYTLDADGEESGLDELVKLEVLYICEEALRNVSRHAMASRVNVRVQMPDSRLRVNIIDDGRGFADARLSKGHGLAVMRERAESVGGWMRVNSIPGSGTEISVEVPKRCPMESQTEK